MGFQWFPGHMARAKRELAAFSARTQFLFHLVDARAPSSTFFPQLAGRKKPLLVLSKADLADPRETDRWKTWFQRGGYEVISPSTLKKGSFWKDAPPSAKAMVVGLPNVGKSTLINLLVGGKKAKTGARPGITRGPQWVKLERFYLLDTPGVFYPHHVPDETGWKLAAVGVIPEKNYETRLYAVAESLVRYAREHYGNFQDAPLVFSQFLEEFAGKQGLLLRGGDPNLPLAASRLILDFQKGKWGRITLETPA